jgi:hypothetical protein
MAKEPVWAAATAAEAAKGPVKATATAASPSYS